MDLPVVEYSETLHSSLNPNPVVPEAADLLIMDYLSPSRLQEITEQENLDNVFVLEMEVNTSETTLGNFGMYLPNLKHLKFFNSVIPTIRDLGTSLGHITVLSLPCCNMSDVDGVASMMLLKELYLSYNNISDISPLSFLDNVEVLDLEGNKISDLNQLDYLTILSKLKTLNLLSNPVCHEMIDGLTYTEFVNKKLPDIKRLDDIEMNHPSVLNNNSESQSLPRDLEGATIEDVDLITAAIKEGLINEETVRCLSPNSPLLLNGDEPSTFRPMSANLFFRPQSSEQSRTGSAGSHNSDKIRGSRPHSSESGDVTLQDETSTLTFGEVICGNPIRALRSKKNAPLPVVTILNRSLGETKMKRPATAASFRRSTNLLPNATTSHQTNEAQEQSKDDVLTELIAWRKMHEQRINVMQNSKVQIFNLENQAFSEESDSEELHLSSDEDDVHFQTDEKFEENEILTTETQTPQPPPLIKEPLTGNRSPISPPPRKTSPVMQPSYLKFVSSPMNGPMQHNNNTLRSKFSPTPPKIGIARPQTAADFRTTKLKKTLSHLSPQSIVPLSSPITHPSTINKQVVSSPHEVKPMIREIKQ